MMMMTMIFLAFDGGYGCEVLLLHYVICLFGSKGNSLRYTIIHGLTFVLAVCNDLNQAKYNNTMKSINTTNTFSSNESQDYMKMAIHSTTDKQNIIKINLELDFCTHCIAVEKIAF